MASCRFYHQYETVPKFQQSSHSDTRNARQLMFDQKREVGSVSVSDDLPAAAR